MNNSKRLLALAVTAALATPMIANATNGMNLEGYGPIASGMGGTSMANDNGTAAMMNNPATLGMMAEGARLDIMVGVLAPDITTTHAASGTAWDSASTSFVMPAMGYASKNGNLTWGVGAFAQGGMGTEYATGGGMQPASPGGAGIMGEGLFTGTNADPAVDVIATIMGAEEFSEVGVMRIMFPVSYNVNDRLNVGGSIDFVRATMDIKMAMPGSTMMDMMMGSPGAPGSLSGTMLGALGLFDGGVAGGYFDFADSNPYTGATQGTGFAGKLGFTYKVDDKLTVGGTYHSKTSLGDLKGDADISMVGVQGGADALVAIDGEMTINNFQWPTTMGLGVSFQYNDKLRLAADVKRIKWADVMKDFSMSFVASQSASNIAYGANGASLDAVLYQNWVDQTVLQIGGEYQATNALVLRAGMSKSDNPIPSTTLNHLFPASVQDSMTFGMGYAFSNTDDVNFALSVVPKESVNTGAGMSIDHAQTNWQLMYSKKF